MISKMETDVNREMETNNDSIWDLPPGYLSYHIICVEATCLPQSDLLIKTKVFIYASEQKMLDPMIAYIYNCLFII